MLRGGASPPTHYKCRFLHFSRKLWVNLQRFLKNCKVAIKLIKTQKISPKNCKFSFIFEKFCNFLSVRGGVLPPYTYAATPLISHHLMDLGPPKKFLRALLMFNVDRVKNWWIINDECFLLFRLLLFFFLSCYISTATSRWWTSELLHRPAFLCINQI